MFAAFALVFRRSWGIGFYLYRNFPDPLLQVLLVPAIFSAARLLLLEGPKMSEHGRKMHKPREPGTVRNRPEPFLTVPDRSWYTTCQITYLQCCKIVFHTVAACQERSGTVWNGSERFLSHMVWFYDYISCFSSPRIILPYRHDFIFKAWQTQS